MTEPNILTTQAFRGLCARYGVTQAQKGARTLLNEMIREEAAQLTKHGMLQADHEGKIGLSKEHAKVAVEMTPEIPRGVY